jgi:hypothetical protein
MEHKRMQEIEKTCLGINGTQENAGDRENLPRDQRRATLAQLQPLLDPDCAATISHLPLHITRSTKFLQLLIIRTNNTTKKNSK